MENKEGIPVGIRTTTLKEIEDRDPSQKRYHDAVLFGIDDPLDNRSQESRYSDIPDGVPYVFGTEGGLHVLYEMREMEPIWKTVKWDGDPPWNRESGRIYFTDRGYIDYAKIAENNQGGWVWQRIEEEPEKPSFETGKEDWEYKIYFSSEFPNSVDLNNQLNKDGWSTTGISDNESFNISDKLESINLEPNYIDGVRFLSYLIIDPDRAEIKIVKWNKRSETNEDNLEKEGWKFVDSNIARTIYVRTKP